MRYRRMSQFTMSRNKASCFSRFRSLKGFSILLCLIIAIVLVAIWEENFFGKEPILTPNRTHYYNENMVKNGLNYPVCKKIDALERELRVEEGNRISEEKRYDELLLRGQLNCGNIRVGLGIFSKRHNIPWMKCVPLIIPAKRRLLGFMKDLCSSQEEANKRYAESMILQRKNVPGFKIVPSDNHDINNKNIMNNKNKDINQNESKSNEQSTMESRESSSYQHHSSPPVRLKRRGVVYTGKGEHFHDIYQSIYSLRLLNVSLPVEIWVNSKDYKLCSQIFSTIKFPSVQVTYSSTYDAKRSKNTEKTNNNGLENNKHNGDGDGESIDNGRNVECMKLPNFVQGFTSKFYALLYTTFSDVLFMDADNIAVNDVNLIFESQQYKDTGSLLWPDLWGNKCRVANENLAQSREKNTVKTGLKNNGNGGVGGGSNDSKGSGGISGSGGSSRKNGERGRDISGFHPGDSSYENHVFFVGHFGGLQWRNNRDFAQEAETGQMAFDLRRHSGLLDLGRKFIEDNEFLKKPINGDKDIFRFAHLIMGEPFSFISHFPGYSFFDHQRDCLVHFFGPINSVSTSTSTTSSSSTSTASSSSTPSSSVAAQRVLTANVTATPTRSIPAPGSISQSSKSTNNRYDTKYEIPMFFHQLKIRNPQSFNQILRLPLSERNSPSECLVLGSIPENVPQKDSKNIKNRRILDNGNENKVNIENMRRLENSANIENGKLTPVIVDANYIRLDNLVEFSSKLFEEVDFNWKNSNSDSLVFWHIGSIKTLFYRAVPWFLKKKNDGFI